MRPDSATSEPVTDAHDCAARLCQAVDRDYDRLYRAVAVLVRRTCGVLRPEEVKERSEEVLNEAVQRALSGAAKFDQARSPVAWVVGIAARVLLEGRHDRRRKRRQVPASDLGEEAWGAILETLPTDPAAGTEADRLDLEDKLARLDEGQRRAIVLHYWQGLDGDDLAQALGAPTAGAARVRVCRALQALRALFGRGKTEVIP